jgi:type IV secretory pathway VirB2 component (pilin)
MMHSTYTLFLRSIAVGYIGVLLFSLLLVPFAVHAQEAETPAEEPTETPTEETGARSSAREDLVFTPLTGIPGVGQISQADGLAEFLNVLYRLCVGAAATLAVLQIIRAGFLWMRGDSITGSKEARELIKMSVFGLVLVLSPVLVFSVIDPRILNLTIDAGGLQLGDTTKLEVREHCRDIPAVHEGTVVQSDFRQCCEAAGFRSVPNNAGQTSFMCTAHEDLEDDASGVQSGGNLFKNVPTTPGEYALIMYDASEASGCIQIVSSSYTTEEACVEAFERQSSERPSYDPYRQCRLVTETYAQFSVSPGGLPYCDSVEPI